MSVIRIVNARQNNLQGITVELPTGRSPSSPAPRAPGRARSPSTPSTPRGSGGTSSRSRPTPSSSSSGCPSRWWTASRASRPSVAIEQRNPPSPAARPSGTATEVYDYLRLLWARVGRSYCRVVRRRRSGGTRPQIATDDVLAAGVPGGCRSPSRSRRSPDWPTRPWWRTCARWASSGSWPTARRTTWTSCRPASTSPGPAELLVVVDRLGRTPEARADRLSESPWRRRSRRARAIALRARTTADGSGSPASPPAAAATRRPPTVTPALFSFNNPRGACASCNGFGAVLEYDESLIVPDPRGAWPRARSTPGPSRATRRRRRILLEFAREPRRRSRQAVAQAQGGAPPRAALRPQGPLRRDLPLPQGPRGEALQAVHPGLPPAVPARARPAPTAAAPGSTPTRWRCGSAATPSPSVAAPIGGRHSRSGWRRWRCTPFEREVAAPDPGPARRPARLPPRRGAGLPDARPADPHAVRRRGAADLALQRARRPAGGHALRAGRALGRPAPARHRPAARAAPPAARRAATRWSSSSTTSRRSSRPTSCSSSAPASGERGGQVVHAGPVPGPRRSRSPASISPGEKRIAVPSLRRPAGPLWLRVRGATLHNLRGVDADIPLGDAHRRHRRARAPARARCSTTSSTGTSRPGSTADIRPSRTWARRSVRWRR